MATFYKAVREDYMDFATRTIRYTPGTEVVHPNPGMFGEGEADGYLSVTTDPTMTIGCTWPLRMLVVEADEFWAPHRDDWGAFGQKRAVHKLRVVREVEAWRYFGDENGERVADLLTRFVKLNDVKFDKHGLCRAMDELSTSIRLRKQPWAWKTDRYYDLFEERHGAVKDISGFYGFGEVIRYIAISDLLDPEDELDATVLEWIEDSVAEFEMLWDEYGLSWWEKLKKKLTR